MLLIIFVKYILWIQDHFKLLKSDQKWLSYGMLNLRRIFQNIPKNKRFRDKLIK